MTDTTPEPTHGPLRQQLIRVMTAVFVVLLVSMLIVGTVFVLAQLVGVLGMNGGLITAAEAAISPWAFGIGATLGIWTLLLSYAHGWKPSEG